MYGDTHHTEATLQITSEDFQMTLKEYHVICCAIHVWCFQYIWLLFWHVVMTNALFQMSPVGMTAGKYTGHGKASWASYTNYIDHSCCNAETTAIFYQTKLKTPSIAALFDLQTQVYGPLYISFNRAPCWCKYVSKSKLSQTYYLMEPLNWHKKTNMEMWTLHRCIIFWVTSFSQLCISF